jgi:hypothetical protein
VASVDEERAVERSYVVNDYLSIVELSFTILPWGNLVKATVADPAPTSCVRETSL